MSIGAGYFLIRRTITFHSRSKTFSLSVRNNVEITRKEQIRIYDRIARSRAFKSMEEAFATVLDNSEGAGLGIVILIVVAAALYPLVGDSVDNLTNDSPLNEDYVGDDTAGVVGMIPLFYWLGIALVTIGVAIVAIKSAF